MSPPAGAIHISTVVRVPRCISQQPASQRTCASPSSAPGRSMPGAASRGAIVPGEADAQARASAAS
jgi:hypothetical protein